jgi:inorganic phosphate transporter, PiT family
MGAISYVIAHGIGGTGGIIVDLIILIAFSSGIYWRSRASTVTAGNVNAEWRGTVAPPRRAEVKA